VVLHYLWPFAAPVPANATGAGGAASGRFGWHTSASLGWAYQRTPANCSCLHYLEWVHSTTERTRQNLPPTTPAVHAAAPATPNQPHLQAGWMLSLRRCLPSSLRRTWWGRCACPTCPPLLLPSFRSQETVSQPTLDAGWWGGVGWQSRQGLHVGCARWHRSWGVVALAGSCTLANAVKQCWLANWRECGICRLTDPASLLVSWPTLTTCRGL